MESEAECVFCRIVTGESPSHKVWENADYTAFLSIYPNTPGVTVVIPKVHQESYIFNAPDEVMTGLMRASREVAKLLDSKLETVGRTAVVFEGFGVDHLHAKLFPLHGTVGQQWHRYASDIKKYFEKYEGYISSHDHERADNTELAQLAKKIRE